MAHQTQPALSRASTRLSGRPGETHSKNSPKQGAGRHESPIYQSLAAAANRAGHTEITASKVHLFTKAGLLPPASVRRSLGNAGFGSEPLPQAEAQLLALGTFRHLTKSHKNLAVLLWIDGWDVPSAVLKEALLEWLPPARVPTSERALDRIDRMASAVAPKLHRRLRPGRIQSTASDAAATLVPAALGVLDFIDDLAGSRLERLIGLHRGRTDSVGTAGPWLRSRPSFGWKVLMRYGKPLSVRRYINALGEEQLEASRAHVRFAVHCLPVLAQAMEARRGVGFAGWRIIAQFGARHAAMLGAVVLTLDRWPALYRRFDQLIEGLTPHVERCQLTVELANEYRRQHRDQARDLRKHGLDGLLARGAARPLTGAEELLDRAAAAVG